MARKHAFTMDSLFGNVFDNIVGEDLTPQKIAIFYLIRHSFRSHFGYRAVPSTRPLKPREKTKLYTILFGLITFEEEIIYDDFRRIVRLIDSEVRRGLYLSFVVSMEKLARGNEHIDLRVEDSLYTGKREYHELAVYELTLTKPLMFMNVKSIMFMWIKRIMAQWEKTSQDQINLLNEEMREWLFSKTRKPLPEIVELYPSLKYQMECSTRARLWVTQQIQTIELSPSKALPYDVGLKWCETIKTRHPDIFSVFLLEAVIHVQRQNQAKAEECIKKFFDLSMFKLNKNSVNASQTHRFAVSCQKPLRYAPLLQGRICRIFGDEKAAKALLSESIQQAQLTLDEACNRMANIELTSIDIIKSKPILELPFEEAVGNNEKDKRVIQQNIHRGAELDEHTQIEAFPVDQEEGFELHEQLISMAKILCILEDMLNVRYCIKSSEHMETGLRMTACSDYSQKTRQVDDCAMSVATSNIMKNGMYQQAKLLSERLINSNFKSDLINPHENEAHAVAGVNLAYSNASMGDLEKGLKIVEKLEKVYHSDINWVCARHVKICKLLICFERSFLDGEYEICERLANVMMTFSSLESILRQALTRATIGDLVGAMKLLETFKCSDIIGKIRIQMQLASIYTLCKQYEKAEKCLEECSKLSTNVTLRNIQGMVARRTANLLLKKGNTKEALKLLLMIRYEIETFANFTEKVLYYFAIGKALRILNHDPSYFLAKARVLTSKSKWFLMEKLIIAEAVKSYDDLKNIPKRDGAVEQFLELENKVEKKFSWLLI